MRAELRARLDRINQGEGDLYEWRILGSGPLDDRLFLAGGMIDDRQGPTRSAPRAKAPYRVIGLIR